MKLVKTFGASAKKAEGLIASLEARGAVNTAKVEAVVRTILADVRLGGDAALSEYAGRFDGLDEGTMLLVPQKEMQDAWDATESVLRDAMQTAQENIRSFAEAQKPREWTRDVAGVKTGQIVRALGSVGCYVPGGRYPLPSTLLMTVTPAQVAGVERIVVCSPKPAQETLAAAWLAGVTEFYRIGGAQAIAMMAFGTETCPRVDKIVGPGNLYVTAAKQLVSHECGIDMPAGPTEIVVTSETGDAAGIAADLVAQAEHDPEALAVLITSSEDLGHAVVTEVRHQAKGNSVAEEALAAQGCVFVTETVAEAQGLTNRLAPEHLSVDCAEDLSWVRNAGSVFVGAYSPQSMGDYISGPNHVLSDGPQRTRARRAKRNGFRQGDYGAAIHTRGACGAWAEGNPAGRSRRIDRTCRERAREDGEDGMTVATGTVKPRAAVLAMPEYHPPLAARTALRLDFNENTFAPSPRVIEVLRTVSAETLTKYPEREPMEAVVAEHFGLQPDEVLLTNGVDEAIHLVCLAFLEEEDEALIATPTFFMYDVSVQMMTRRLTRVQADETFVFPFERFMAAINQKTKLIMISSPNNPTGAVVSRDHLLAICEAAPQAVVMVDEAYYHFHGETTIGDVPAMPNLIVARTFSKAYGLAHLRIGMLAGEATLLSYVRKVTSPL